jgi:hypothetical protein
MRDRAHACTLPAMHAAMQLQATYYYVHINTLSHRPDAQACSKQPQNKTPTQGEQRSARPVPAAPGLVG